MPLIAYRRAESGEAVDSWSIPEPSIGKLRPNEICTLLRRRSGMTLDQLSEAIKVSKWYLCQMERGSAPTKRLLEFWKTR